MSEEINEITQRLTKLDFSKKKESSLSEDELEGN
jgi:hypothetical protein